MNAVGFAVFWASTSAPLAVAGLLVCGLGVSLYFPLGLSRAIAVSDGRPDQATARVGVGAALASGVGPFVLGALADAAGIHARDARRPGAARRRGRRHPGRAGAAARAGALPA